MNNPTPELSRDDLLRLARQLKCQRQDDGSFICRDFKSAIELARRNTRTGDRHGA